MPLVVVMVGVLSVFRHCSRWLTYYNMSGRGVPDRIYHGERPSPDQPAEHVLQESPNLVRRGPQGAAAIVDKMARL
jgi:hypothetical protein